ncbi:hypothetical protein UK23_33255 [Lentzea aerocolonigenes]|uniref:Uncharacterized protein n=2 Tax=Lentzea aerocolonigenes TaxID=68170 RepID=A0A0F0GPU3_LENAE|nr:hypothetical protein UK23_33255 [Lentzea aerocolonigenes]
MSGCRIFQERDRAGYDEMARFLTDVAQGVLAYKEIALACIDDYLDGDQKSAEGVAERVNLAADPKLDDMDDDYEAAPWVPPAPREDD